MGRLVAALVSTLLLASCALAQSTFRGGLSGIVADLQGAGIPEAQVEVTNISTAVVYKTASSATGAFSLSDLPLGAYRIAVTYPGFTTMTVHQICITAGVIYNLPVTLKVDAATTAIAVDAAHLHWTSPARSSPFRFLRKRSPTSPSMAAAIPR